MFWFILAASLTSADLGIKNYIKKNIAETDQKKILGDKVIITKFTNKGAALGFLKDKTRELIGISLVCFGIIFGMLLMLTHQKGNIFLKLGLAMMLGGAGSNVYERLTNGGVTDYFKLDIGIKKLKNIIFNIGDFLIIFGSILTVLGFSKKN